MKKGILSALAPLLLSQIIFASPNLCFDESKLSGDTISLKLNNLAKTIENNAKIKGLDCTLSSRDLMAS